MSPDQRLTQQSVSFREVALWPPKGLDGVLSKESSKKPHGYFLDLPRNPEQGFNQSFYLLNTTLGQNTNNAPEIVCHVERPLVRKSGSLGSNP